ncbi:DUF397 domain-containing protein [Streptomyces sp. RKND-216]|uniref:DUF397 domain-containing protein n=1 Tax=Streptomyces sp. RKND-216 TaxID=2562581 RepID=UPI00144835E3|nr:DUF397 domain-containing protein [Streptomyces sp. RKND-216]
MSSITVEPSHLRWVTSSHSGSDGGDCVEVAATPGMVHVRDSKDHHGPRLRFPAHGWSAFLSYAGQDTDV